MDELFNGFIRERVFLHNLSPRTIGYYKQMHCFWKAVGAFDPLTKGSLQESVIKFRERGVSPGAINTYIRGVNPFSKWLHREHGYSDLSLKSLKAPKQVLKALTNEQIKILMNWKAKSKFDKRLKTLTLTLLDTGLRIDEALSLERDNLDFENLLLTVVGKGDKERIIPFSIELRKLLFKHLATHQFSLVFCTQEGSKITYCNALRDFTRMAKSLGVKPQGSAFHALRRTFATNFVKRGGNPFILQRILGHADISQTMEYVKLVTLDLQEAYQGTSVLTKLK